MVLCVSLLLDEEGKERSKNNTDFGGSSDVKKKNFKEVYNAILFTIFEFLKK